MSHSTPRSKVRYHNLIKVLAINEVVKHKRCNAARHIQALKGCIEFKNILFDLRYRQTIVLACDNNINIGAGTRTCQRI